MTNNKAYTFDDILILPKHSEIEREDVDIRSYFHYRCLSIPVLSAPMDTITEIQMMKAMLEAGGLGFHHRYCDFDKLLQAEYHGGVAVSPSMGLDNVLKLQGDHNPYPIVVLDVAHGDTKKNLDFCAELVKNKFIVVSGNIATVSSAGAYLNIGVRIFRVGVGSGSVCTTRTVTGIGMPQASAIRWIYDIFKDDDVIIISDGGHRTTGDIVKALASGADYVMLGGMLAGCHEVPELGKSVYRGMASRDARDAIGKLDTISEGITKEVKANGSVKQVLKDIEDAIKLACYYVGAKNIKELRERSEIIIVTENSYKEGLPRY